MSMKFPISHLYGITIFDDEVKQQRLWIKFTKCTALVSANHAGLFPTFPNKMCRKPLLMLSRIHSFLSILRFPFQFPGILAFGDLVGQLGSRETDLSLLVEVWATDILIGRSTEL